jgi:glutamate synthase (NADPH/NADH) small chain
VLVATGVYEARDLAVPGAGPTTIVPAMRFLTAENRRGLHDRVSEDEPHAEAKNVVVIGGGDTAMDCVRTAIRQGARSVTCLYRRDRENMPGSQREVTNAEEEGVVFEWLTAPRAITADSVIAQPMRLGAPGPDGRRRPEAIESEHFTVPADMVIAALGYEAEDLAQAFRSADLGFRKDGTLRVRPATFETAMDGVFAAGDIARGASLVVHAVKDGMDAAQAIDRYLRRKGPSLERQRITDSTQPAEVA